MNGYPIKLNDNYTCQGHDSKGKYVVFGDLLSEGDTTTSWGTEDDPGGADGVVVRKSDGLWVVAI